VAISILIADAQYLIRRGLNQVLQSEKEFDVISEVGSEEELLSEVVKKDPDVVIMDFDQPGFFTEETITKVKEISPFTGIMVVSGNTSQKGIHFAVENGINSFITKQCDEKEIVNAVLATSKKEKFFCHKVLEKILEKSFGSEEEACEPIPLSPREIEVVQQIATGRIAKEIASELHLSTHTIYTHRKNIMRKLGLSSPVELVMYAINKGLVDPKNA